MGREQLASSERAVWLLHHRGFQVLVLSEDDRVVISERISSRDRAGELVAAALDLDTDPVFSFGPGSFRLALEDLTSVTVQSAFDVLVLEAATDVHRIEGWKSDAVVIGGLDSIGMPLREHGAVRDAYRRIQHRRSRSAPSPVREGGDPLEGSLGSSVRILPWRMVAERWLGALLILGIAGFFVARSLPPTDPFDYVFLAVAGLLVVLALLARSPGAVIVDEEGISWGSGRQSTVHRWPTIGSVVGQSVGTGFLNGRGITLFVTNESASVDESSFHEAGYAHLVDLASDVAGTPVEIRVEPTNYMSATQRRRFLAAIRRHKPDIVVLADDPDGV